MDLNDLEEIRKGIDAELDELYELSNVIHSLKNVIEYFNKNGMKVSLIGF
jgi:hypothetical protein